MHYIKNFFLIFFIYNSYAFDSTRLKPSNSNPKHQTPQIDIDNVKYQKVNYAANGDQISKVCPPNYSLVHIQNKGKQVYWGPPEEICAQFGRCSKFGCWCIFSPHSCCAWCSPPCISKINSVRWQNRPTKNQASATRENMPSVLSDVGCAPIKNIWV
ncbi:hypothetical protein N9L02_01795 [Gammaproteobacteria bacterium]|nr:hypothetical protein [Gammaproteobacteria bacterium]